MMADDMGIGDTSAYLGALYDQDQTDNDSTDHNRNVHTSERRILMLPSSFVRTD